MMHEHDPLNYLLDYGVDIRNRRIFLHGDVDEDTIAFAVRGLMHMDSLSGADITIFISSYGGSIDETFVLHDVIVSMRSKIITVALGFCMSAAPLLVAAGHTRLASVNCDFMMHAASLGTEGTLANVEVTAAATRARCERMDRLLAKYSNMPYRHWKRFTESKADVYFDSERALEWGIIDGMW